MFLFFATYGFEFDSMDKCRPNHVTNPLDWLEIHFWMGNPKKKISPMVICRPSRFQKGLWKYSYSGSFGEKIKININIGSHGGFWLLDLFKNWAIGTIFMEKSS